MKRSIEEIFFELLRSEVCGAELSFEIKNEIIPESFSSIYKLAKSHDLAHVVAEALKKNGFLPEDSSEEMLFLKERNMAIYRYEQMQYEYIRITRTLEEFNIPYLPLKGAVLRKYYREPWHRTSCDVDILVQEEDLKKAVKVLEKNTDFRIKGRLKHHDLSMFSSMGVHLELHYSICEYRKQLDEILSQVWNHACPVENKSYHYVLSNEFFMFHILAHMAFHFIRGGCGVRAVLDVWILNRFMQYDRKKVEELCEKAGILTFFHTVYLLADVWFSGKEGNELTQQVGKYILEAGVYGTKENRMAVNSVQSRGRFKYLLSYIFPPYSMLIKQYPIVQKFKILYPFCIVYRWFARLFQGRAKSAFKNVKVTVKQTGQRVGDVQNILNQLELQNL